MKKALSIIVLICIAASFSGCFGSVWLQTPNQRDDKSEDSIVQFNDPLFEKSLRKAHNLYGDIHTSDLLEIEDLTLQRCGLSDISDVAKLKNLRWLDLQYNDISDISALKNLDKLEVLWLTGNNISDISALSGLTRIYSLGLAENRISDISALKNMNGLVMLSLDKNPVRDITVLHGKIKFQNVYLNSTSLTKEQIKAFKESIPSSSRVYP